MLKKSLLLIAPFLLIQFTGNALPDATPVNEPAAQTIESVTKITDKLAEMSNTELTELVKSLRIQTEQENQRHLKTENHLFWCLVSTAAVLLVIDGLLLMRENSTPKAPTIDPKLASKEKIITLNEEFVKRPRNYRAEKKSAVKNELLRLNS